MNQHTPLCLCSHNKEDRDKVGRQSRPRSITDCHDSSIDKGIYHIVIEAWNEQVIAIFYNLNAQSAEGIQHDSKVFYRGILNADTVAYHSCHGNKRAYLYHI